jgi:hypothetical protein
MRDWIVALVFYLFALGVFRAVGGLGAAGEALRRWGRATSTVRTNPGSSS